MKKISKEVLILTPIIIGLMFLVGYVFVIKPHHFSIFTINSGSMDPEIKKGSLIITRKVGKYIVGEVVATKPKNTDKTITHRINREEMYSSDIKIFYTKGDANQFEDKSPITKDEIIGKVICKIPLLGVTLTNVTSYKLLALTFYAPAGFVFGKKLKNRF